MSDSQSAGQPSGLDTPRDPEVELVVRVIGGERELRQEEADRPPAMAPEVPINPPGEGVEVGEIRVAVTQRALSKRGPSEREWVVAVQVHPRGAAVRQAHRSNELPRADVAGGEGVASDDEVPAALALQAARRRRRVCGRSGGVPWPRNEAAA